MEIQASPDGQYFSLRCRNKTLWLVKDGKEATLANVSGQGQVNSASFDEQGRLWYANRNNRAYLLNLADSQTVESLQPETGWFVKLYEYGISPLYWAFPKPGEFYKLVSHLVRQGESKTGDEEDQTPTVDLRIISDQTNPWEPLWSGLAFMCVTLFITGLIFHFRDF